jgi:hypothetical protein
MKHSVAIQVEFAKDAVHIRTDLKYGPKSMDAVKDIDTNAANIDMNAAKNVEKQASFMSKYLEFTPEDGGEYYVLSIPTGVTPPKTYDKLDLNGVNVVVVGVDTPIDIAKGRGGPIARSMEQNGIAYRVNCLPEGHRYLKDMRKKADGEFINERDRLYYPNGEMTMIGDRVEHDGKTGNVINLDKQTVNIKYDDGLGMDNVPIENVRKIASMKHLAAIQSEFIKEARKWTDLSLEDQRAYLKRHPKSKRTLSQKKTDKFDRRTTKGKKNWDNRMRKLRLALQ